LPIRDLWMCGMTPVETPQKQHIIIIIKHVLIKVTLYVKDIAGAPHNH